MVHLVLLDLQEIVVKLEHKVHEDRQELKDHL